MRKRSPPRSVSVRARWRSTRPASWRSWAFATSPSSCASLLRSSPRTGSVDIGPVQGQRVARHLVSELGCGLATRTILVAKVMLQSFPNGGAVRRDADVNEAPPDVKKIYARGRRRLGDVERIEGRSPARRSE